MTDKRAYFHTDVGYFDNPKLADLVEDQPRAVILHLRAIAYCAQHLTDGIFPMRLVMRLACGSQCDLDALVQCGLVRVVDDVNAEVHDYLKHQRSAESVGKAKAAGQRAAAARWSRNSDADGNADRIADGNAEPNAKREREKERETTTPNAADAAAFEEFWDTYSKKTGRKKSEAKWKLALRKPGVTSELLITAARSYIKSQVADGNHPKYTKDPATWLNGEHWNDEAAPATRRPGGVAQLRPRGQVMSDFTEDEWAALPIEERAAIADRTTMGHLT